MKFWNYLFLSIVITLLVAAGIAFIDAKHQAKAEALAPIHSQTFRECPDCPEINDCRTQDLQIDSLKTINDSLRVELFLSNYTVESVRYYYKICKRNPKKKVFFFGWIKRALNEK